MQSVTTLVASALSLLVITASAGAATIVNGSMSYVGSPPNSFNNLIPSGWLPLTGSTDLFDATTNFSSFVWNGSPGGGTFVHGIGGNGSYNEGLYQTVVGLVIGQQYSITFEQSISNSDFGMGTAGYWEVTFGTSTFDSSAIAMPSVGVPSAWFGGSSSFVATAVSQDLEFLARSTLTGNFRVDMGLDDVRITAVPQPSTSLLLAIGLLGMSARRTRSRRTLPS